MLQTLPIAFAQVNTSNTSENLLNEIHQIMYSLINTLLYQVLAYTIYGEM